MRAQGSSNARSLATTAHCLYPIGCTTERAGLAPVFYGLCEAIRAMLYLVLNCSRPFSIDIKYFAGAHLYSRPVIKLMYDCLCRF